MGSDHQIWWLLFCAQKGGKEAGGIGFEGEEPSGGSGQKGGEPDSPDGGRGL